MTSDQLWLQDHLRCYARNFRWGTCGGCPRDADGGAFPERCEFTDRYDHNLTGTSLAERVLKEDASRNPGRADHYSASRLAVGR